MGIDITKATLEKYNRCIRYIKEFIKLRFKNNDIAVASLTGTLLMEFFYFLRTNKSNSHNNSLNYIKYLKTVLMSAIKKQGP